MSVLPALVKLLSGQKPLAFLRVYDLNGQVADADYHERVRNVASVVPLRLDGQIVIRQVIQEEEIGCCLSFERRNFC